MTKEEARLSVMGAISMALKAPTLQQGFEIICKNLAELEKGNEMQALRIKERDELLSDLKTLIEKMKCCGNCKYFNFNEPNYCHKGVYRERQYVCSEWEFGN